MTIQTLTSREVPNIVLMLPERWLSVVGYEGLYEVSDHARLRTVERLIRAPRGTTRLLPGAVMKTQRDREGYEVVHLWRDGEKHQHRVHVLVGAAFLDRPDGAWLVRHLNDNRRQNGLLNLAWGTAQDNSDDKIANAGHYLSQRQHCPRRHPLTPPNLVASEAAKGKRSCLACARARGICRTRPDLDFLIVADQKYRQITEVAA